MVCAHGRALWDFSCLPVPPSPMVGTHKPANPSTPKAPALMVSNVPFHSGDIGSSFYCCPQTTLAGVESIPARASLTTSRISMSEASVSPCPLEAQFRTALGELAQAQRIIDPRAYLSPSGFCGFVLGLFVPGCWGCLTAMGTAQPSGCGTLPRRAGHWEPAALLHSLTSLCYPSHPTDLNG